MISRPCDNSVRNAHIGNNDTCASSRQSLTALSKHIKWPVNCLLQLMTINYILKCQNHIKNLSIKNTQNFGSKAKDFDVNATIHFEVLMRHK